jgi:hypothetical protein
MTDLEQSRQQTKLTLATEILRTTGRVQFMARGYSMLPSLWPGDVLTVQRVPFADATPGQIVLYRRNEQFYAHRLLRRGEDDGSVTVITRGDAMPENDETVSQAEWLGVVTSVARSGKELSRVPQCNAFTRAFGCMLGSSNRLRSMVLRLKQGSNSTGAAPLTEILPGSF